MKFDFGISQWKPLLLKINWKGVFVDLVKFYVCVFVVSLGVFLAIEMYTEFLFTPYELDINSVYLDKTLPDWDEAMGPVNILSVFARYFSVVVACFVAFFSKPPKKLSHVLIVLFFVVFTGMLPFSLSEKEVVGFFYDLVILFVVAIGVWKFSMMRFSSGNE